MEAEQLKIWLEGALLAAGQPLTLTQLNSLFDEDEQPGHGAIREALALLDAELSDRAIEMVEVAGGYRLQVRARLMPVISRLWAEKPPRYSRALLETLAIIAYRQPITRGEIEQIRGVSLSANILKTLQEREWIKVVGHRDMPGRPELLGTTRVFLDYFNLKGLDDLPTLAEIRDLDNIEPELDLANPEQPQAANHDQQQAQQDPDGQDETGQQREDASTQAHHDREQGAENEDQRDGDAGSEPESEQSAQEEGSRSVDTSKPEADPQADSQAQRAPGSAEPESEGHDRPPADRRQG